jgi:DNA-directed RNA polymerase specialized sigma24 family protein
MSSEGSVTHWLDRLRAGDHAAAQPLWERYFRQMVQLARQRLRGRPGRVADEEDVALSAFDSFCRGAEQGRFPQLRDRDNLWRLLMVITARKATALRRYEERHKRRAPPADAPAEGVELDEVLGREPSPEFAAQVAEQCQHLLARLGSAELTAIAVWKMEGYRNDEIAGKLDYVPRTVERKLRLIRQLWAEEAPS